MSKNVKSGILVITLALALPDKTWVEYDVEIDGTDNCFDPDGEIYEEDITQSAFDALPEGLINTLAPSFWKMIHWEWKEEKVIKNGMTIDEAISALQKAKSQSSLGGKAIVFVCVQDEPYIPLTEVKVDNDPSGGSSILFMPQYEPDGIED